jgi:Co/Zn/Cd efflux system component
MKSGAGCCEDKGCEIAAMATSHRRVLWLVLAINAVMFAVEGWAGLLAHSTSLLADALDMLGDALVYGFSLFVLARPPRWQAGAALAKGGFMLAFGMGVLLAAAVCYAASSRWPDIVVGGLIAGLFLNSSLGVLRAAIRDFRKPFSPAPQPMKPATIRFSKSGR